MEKFRSLLRQSEFQVLLFSLGLVALSWPFVGICTSRQPQSLFAYLFGIWMILILFLILVSRSLTPPALRNDKEEGPEAAHD